MCIERLFVVGRRLYASILRFNFDIETEEFVLIFYLAYESF